MDVEVGKCAFARLGGGAAAPFGQTDASDKRSSFPFLHDLKLGEYPPR